MIVSSKKEADFMKKLASKIMNANFKKLWIRYLVICLCAALVGGGVSAALLRPQISSAPYAGISWRNDHGL